MSQNKKKAKNVRKVESPLKSSSPVVTPKKRPAAEAFVPRVNEVIAYTHEVLPTKHKKPTPWSTLISVYRQKPVRHRELFALVKTSGSCLLIGEAALSDGSASIKLDIWEDQIPLVELLRVYSFVGVRVREWNNNLSLSTSHDTKIEELPESESGTLSSVNVDTEPDIITMSAKVSSVVAIESIEAFMQCVNVSCRKKIEQDSGKLMIHCDLCGYRMSRSRCQRNMIVNFMAQTTTKNQPLCLVMFKDVFANIYPKLNDQDTVHDYDDICESLLSLENFKVYHNERDVVNAIKLYGLND